MAKRSTNLNRANKSARPRPAGVVELMRWVGMSEDEIAAAVERMKARMAQVKEQGK